MKSLCRKALFASLSFITICLIVICPAQAAIFCVSGKIASLWDPAGSWIS
jgi:hypothetical protein